jgi:hypothetical protein
LKELIGGRDPSKTDSDKLPLDVLCWKWEKASLISVAAAVGGEPLRYLFGFHATVAFGDWETMRMVWDGSDEEERVSNPALIRLAINFDHVEVARWLLQEQRMWRDLGRLFAQEARAFDVLSRLSRGGQEFREMEI